jgi:hypothetical protein
MCSPNGAEYNSIGHRPMKRDDVFSPERARYNRIGHRPIRIRTRRIAICVYRDMMGMCARMGVRVKYAYGCAV